MGGSVPAASEACQQSRASAGPRHQERGWMGDLVMDSAKDCGREMLAAINVEGSVSGCFLFLSQ